MWEEIKIKSRMPHGTPYVSISWHGYGCSLIFPVHLTPDFKGYKYCKTLIDVNKRLIGLQLTNANDINCNKITFSKPGYQSNERTSIAFTRQWNVAKDKLRLQDIEKSLKYELKKEKDDFFVIDCNKPLK